MGCSDLLGLLVAAVLKVAVLLDKVEIVEHHAPHLGHTQVVKARVGEHLGCPATLRSGKQVKGVAEVRCGQLGTLGIIAIGVAIMLLRSSRKNPELGLDSPASK